MSFVRGANPIWFFNDLTGQPLDDTYFAFFLKNDVPHDPQAVYMTPNGTPWSDPIQFQPNGGLPDNIYFDPTLVYRIEVRHGDTQVDPLIYLVENYSLGDDFNEVSGDPLITAENLITNPEFVDIYFSSPLIITTAGTYDIAPGWRLEITGSGVNTTITQNVNSGDAQIFGNPSYYLTFNSTGWNSVKLIQTFSRNGAIFSGGACAVAFTAVSSGNANSFSVNYHPITDVGKTLFSGSIPTGSFNHYQNAVDIPLSNNTNTGENALVDIEFILPATGIISLSNIQITGQSTPLTAGFNANPTPPVYKEESYERMVDHEFHVYKDSILLQPKENILTGWNFSLNPWQFTTTTITNVADNRYTADQTIVVQQNYVNSATGNNVAVGRGTAAQNYAFSVQAVTANNKFAIVQYIDTKTIAQYWGSNLSAMVKASIVTSHSTALRFKMRLIYRTSLPPTVSQTDPIATWTGLGEPVFAAGWTSISPLNDPTYTLSSTDELFSFDRFTLPNSSTDNMILGVVLYTTTAMDQTATADIALFKSISLVHNDFAIEASSETFDQTFKKCQFYYEKSWDYNVLPGTNSFQGAETSFNQSYQDTGSNLSGVIPTLFHLRYKQVKRSSPSVVFYSGADGAINNIAFAYIGGEANNPPVVSSNFLYASYYTNNVPPSASTSNSTYGIGSFPIDTHPVLVHGIPAGSIIREQSLVHYHYTADARLGI